MSVSTGLPNFGGWDWAAVAFTLGVSIMIGLYIWFKRYTSEKNGQNDSGDNFLLGDRNMKPLSTSISMLVTYFSAIAIIGYPTEIFAHGVQIFFMNMILSVICIPASVGIFVIVLHKLKLTSVYEYLQLRYKSPLVRKMASVIFILETTMITGVALYVPSIPLQKLLGFTTITSIIVIGFCGSLYTSLGGLQAVIFTDCFQFILIVLGLVAIIFRGMYIAGGLGTVFEIAEEHGRLKFFDPNINFFQNYNTLNIMLGFSITLTCFYGAHQPNFQRYSSLPSIKAAVQGMLFNVLLQEVATTLIILAGLSIVAAYVRCDPILTNRIQRVDEIVPFFVQDELSFIPGMMGLFVSCILSAVLSTVSSSLNSLAAVTWEDFISKIHFFRGLSQSAKEWAMIGLSFFYGVIIMGVAYTASTTESIFQTSIIVMGSTSGTVGGAFIMALFVPSSNFVGVSVGMVVGLCSVSYLSAKNLLLNLSRVALPTGVDGCTSDVASNYVLNNTTFIPMTGSQPTIETYPEKLYTISIVLYPIIAAAITCTCGIIVSIVASYFLDKKYIIDGNGDLDKYIHPVVPLGRRFLHNLKNRVGWKSAHIEEYEQAIPLKEI